MTPIIVNKNVYSNGNIYQLWVLGVDDTTNEMVIEKMDEYAVYDIIDQIPEMQYIWSCAPCRCADYEDWDDRPDREYGLRRVVGFVDNEVAICDFFDDTMAACGEREDKAYKVEREIAFELIDARSVTTPYLLWRSKVACEEDAPDIGISFESEVNIKGVIDGSCVDKYGYTHIINDDIKVFKIGSNYGSHIGEVLGNNIEKLIVGENVRTLKVVGSNDRYNSSVGLRACDAVAKNRVFPSKLMEVVINNGLEVISTDCFYGCSRLREVKLPKTLKFIGARAFKDCTSLKSIEIPEGVKYIGEEAFSGCTGLESIILPNGVIHIGDYAFMDTGITKVEIPKSVDYIGCSAFSSTKITELCIPDTVKYLGPCVRNCKELKKVTMPNNLNGFLGPMFDRCSNLEKVTFKSVDLEIDKDTFRNCKSLKIIEVPDGFRREYTWKEDYLDKCGVHPEFIKL